jgi:hypothetical protein
VRRIAADINATIRIPETYWVGTDVRELESIASSLPKRWVLKPNHSAGRHALIDSSKAPVDWAILRELGDQWIQRDEEELVMGHWAYGQARHLLIAEERVGGGEQAPSDIKVACCDGVPMYYFWADRSTDTVRLAFFTPDGERFIWGDERETQLSALAGATPLPETIRNAMLRIGSAVGAPFDCLRIDFYVEDGAIWFGELAPYTAGGLYAINDMNDERFGAMWTLPDLSAPDPRESEWRALLHGVPKGTLQ